MAGALKKRSKTRALALQSSMEHTLTYSFMLVILMAVVAALYFLGFFTSASYGENACIPTAGFLCSNPIIASNGLLTITFGQSGTTPIQVTAIGCSNSATGNTISNTLFSTYLEQGTTVVGSVTCPGMSNVILGTPITGGIWIYYSEGSQSGLLTQIGSFKAVVMTGSAPSTGGSSGPSYPSLAIDGYASAQHGSTTSVSVTLTTANTNDIIVVFGGVGNLDSALTVSSSGVTPALTWHTRAVKVAPLGFDANVIEAYAVSPNALSSGATITLTSASSGNLNIIAFGVTGANTVSPFDGSSSVPATASNEAVPASINTIISTTSTNDLLIGSFLGGGSGTWTAPSGFSSITSVTGGPSSASFYDIVHSTQPSLLVSGSYSNGGSSVTIFTISDAIRGII